MKHVQKLADGGEGGQGHKIQLELFLLMDDEATSLYLGLNVGRFY